MPDPAELRARWALDPGVRFLNHGSFGATPRAVLDAQQELRARMEREPVLFLARELEGRLDAARAPLARFLGCAAEDLAFVTNATTAVNAVAGSLELAPGDELLVTDHGYRACTNALARAAERAGARLVVARVPLPLRSADAAVDAVLAAATPRTRFALLDHVTSPTALVLPVERLAAALRERGVLVMVDGAHAPGMLPLDVPAVGADLYAGNLHKWVCAPKGAAFLWARRELQPRLRPVVTSHAASSARRDRSRFLQEFDWTGTQDPTPWLCVPAALEHQAGLLPGGWPALLEHQRALARAARAILLAELGGPPLCPDEHLGAMAAVRVADGPPDPPSGAVDPLQARLWERARIEVPVHPWPAPPRRLLRVSAPAYLDLDDVRALAAELALAGAAPPSG